MIEVQTAPLAPRADWLLAPPPAWEARLRSLSPITERLSHLRFRYRQDDEQWALYDCIPAAMLSPERVQQLSVHWTSLPKSEQRGRKSSVSEYQFYMFNTHRLAVSLYWILQGTEYLVGGTPFGFTPREERLMEAEGLSPEPFPPGTFPAIPFDERVVSVLGARDRLRKYGDRLDATSTVEGLEAEDRAAEREYRKQYLAWHHQQQAPTAEFFKWYTKTKESRSTLRPAQKGLANTLSDFKDQFIETGVLPQAGTASSRIIQVSVL